LQHEQKTNSLEQSILTSIKEATIEIEKKEITSNLAMAAEENLELGKPLDFSSNEKHSFQEWLQLSRVQPVVREKEIGSNNTATALNDDKKKKLELIDKFIEASPKIPPIKPGLESTTNFEPNQADNSYLMTETLARVYLEQKKYQRAIQAYEILILKYPEKSSFFADRISDIKILQQNNK
jgi:hypothetical protein